MNKELILEYKKEFEHWLKGGKILHLNIIDTLDWKDIYCDDIWLDTCITSYKKLIIINDEYVEFRKALAEGKTIQFKTEDCGTWEDTNEPKFSQPITSYRIKPEEPKFKVGDWIRQGDYVIKVYRIDSDYYYGKVNGCIAIDKAEKWEPRRGQLCWFWTPAEKLLPKLGKFLQMEAHNQYYASFGSGNYSCEANLYCEPFIGALPEYIKELKL